MNTRAVVWRFPDVVRIIEQPPPPDERNISSRIPVPKVPHAEGCECDECEFDEFDW